MILFPITRPTVEDKRWVPLSPQGHFLFFLLLLVISIPAIIGTFFSVSGFWLFLTR